MIQIINTNIDDCILLKYDQFADERGYFCEIFKQSILPLFKPTQVNYSFSKRNVLRGVHQTSYAKLITCLYGNVYDVVVDLRPSSKTYLQHFTIDLTPESNIAVYIPPYCGHGFYAYIESLVIYSQGGEYDITLEKNYFYESFDIQWPKSFNSPILSNKDSVAPRFLIPIKEDQ